MQEIKTFRRPIRKSKVAIPLFGLITIFVGSIIVILLYTDLQNPNNLYEFLYILLIGIGFIINSIGIEFDSGPYFLKISNIREITFSRKI